MMSKYGNYLALAKANGIKDSTFYQRVRMLKWDPERAATQPPHPRGNHDYAVYKGDELIVVGTAEECAEFMGVTKAYIQALATPKRRKRSMEKGGTYAIKLEDDDDE